MSKQPAKKPYVALSSAQFQQPSPTKSPSHASSPNSSTSPSTDPTSGFSTAISQKDLVKFFSEPSNCSASLIIQQLSYHNDHEDGHRGCFQFLVNKLYELKYDTIEFFLAQLLYDFEMIYLTIVETFILQR
jgi:hypothetical protein